MSFQNKELNSLLYELNQSCLLKEKLKNRFVLGIQECRISKWETNELEIMKIKTNWEIGKLDKFINEVLSEKLNIGVIGWVEVIKKEYDEKFSNDISAS